MLPTRPAASTHRTGPRTQFSRLLMWLWILGVSMAFYCRQMPNSHVSRLDFWQAVPWLLLDFFWPIGDDAPTWGALWQGLLQRLPLLAMAGAVLLSAHGYGRVLARWVIPVGWLSRAERTYFALLLGVLALGTVELLLGLLGFISSTAAWSLVGGGVALAVWSSWTRRETRSGQLASKPPSTGGQSLRVSPLTWVTLGTTLLFGAVLTLGSLSPQTDFDVKEYHLTGPKEWYLAGRITFLEHNVYTTFPFLTEMPLLLGMQLHGSWRTGSLVGQAVLGSFALLTAWGLYLAAKRWHSHAAGCAAVVFWISAPWVCRMSSIAYAEGGLVMYGAGACYALGVILEQLGRAATPSTPRPLEPLLATFGRDWLRAGVWGGLLAGGAMACKYPGALFVVAPLGLVLLVADRRRLRSWRLTAGFTLGLMVSIGPWLMRNLVWTGNPVYPLAGRWFGSIDWSPAWQAQWAAAHAPPRESAVAWVLGLPGQALDIALVNDWQSPLVATFAAVAMARGLAPLCARLIGRPLSRTAGPASSAEAAPLWDAPSIAAAVATGLTMWMFVVWYGATHRIDRFWLPLLPLLCFLAGLAAPTVFQRLGRWASTGIVAAGLVFNLAFVTTGGLIGYNAWLSDLPTAQDFTARLTVPEIAALNEQFRLGLPLKVLAVGEAEVFDAEFPVLYNTVFDESLLPLYCVADETAAGKISDGEEGRVVLLAPDEALRRLRAEGITHVLVNWGEILRYRLSYRYDARITPDLFEALVLGDVLTPEPMRGIGEPVPLKNFSAAEVEELRSWGEPLLRPRGARGTATSGTSDERRVTLSALYAVGAHAVGDQPGVP